MPATPVLLDVDTGIDDAHALLLALRHPALEVRGVTTVAGNLDIDTVTAATLQVLDAAGAPPGLPVARGCAAPLVEPCHYCPLIHGEDGLGDLQPALPASQPPCQPASPPRANSNVPSLKDSFPMYIPLSSRTTLAGAAKYHCWSPVSVPSSVSGRCESTAAPAGSMLHPSLDCRNGSWLPDPSLPVEVCPRPCIVSRMSRSRTSRALDSAMNPPRWAARNCGSPIVPANPLGGPTAFTGTPPGSTAQKLHKNNG